jgi:tetratricopeptide (TPR) repeat protein
MGRSGRIFCMAVALPLAMGPLAMGPLAMSGPAAFADELSDAASQVFNDPANAELNLDYALIAEGQGKYRLALSAYERVLLNDPNNVAAKRGLIRVRRVIQPPSTQKFFDFGIKAESNATHDADGDDGDVYGFSRVRIRDERTLNGVRWRTTGSLYGELHAMEDELNYAQAAAVLGPIFDLGASMMTFHPAIGGGVAMADEDFYYADVNVSALFEGYLDGVYQWVRLRGGYRQYGEDSTADQGFYVDAAARKAWSDVFVENDAVYIAPMIRWSDIDGTFDDGLEEFSPGKYLLGSVRLGYDHALSDLVNVGASVEVAGRRFADDEAPDGDDREDWTITPGVSMLLKDVFGPQTGLRFEYEYEYNESNDPDHDYDNHIVGVTASIRR